MNISKKSPNAKTGSFFRFLSHPTRLRIIQEIGTGEACVCHLETQLSLRQAYLSQHLMALRDAGILETQRDGRFIYYRLTNPEILNIIQAAMKITGSENMLTSDREQPKKACCCPKCNPET
jgi:DNA-binding transcriptional ArsR family regulator